MSDAPKAKVEQMKNLEARQAQEAQLRQLQAERMRQWKEWQKRFHELREKELELQKLEQELTAKEPDRPVPSEKPSPGWNFLMFAILVVSITWMLAKWVYKGADPPRYPPQLPPPPPPRR